jgi:hypothetical protein
METNTLMAIPLMSFDAIVDSRTGDRNALRLGAGPGCGASLAEAIALDDRFWKPEQTLVEFAILR